MFQPLLDLLYARFEKQPSLHSPPFSTTHAVVADAEDADSFSDSDVARRESPDIALWLATQALSKVAVPGSRILVLLIFMAADREFHRPL